jgi:hypothetical protein
MQLILNNRRVPDNTKVPRSMFHQLIIVMPTGYLIYHEGQWVFMPSI